MIDFWARPHQSFLYWLWAQHNEHRIALPKLLLLIDYRAFQGRDIFLLAMNLVFELAFVMALLWALRSWRGLRGTAWRTATGLALFCGFCASQWENYISGFQISFFLVNFFFTIAVILMLLSRQERDRGREWKRAAGAALAGVAATYSAANGILIWPLLVAISLQQRSRRAITVLLSASGMAVLASYLYHYISPSYHSSPLTSIRHPYELLLYVTTYLGSPLDWGHPGRAAVFGVAGLLAAALAVWLILFRFYGEPDLLLLASLLLLVIGSDAMTALGRVGFGVDQARSSRYEIFGLLFWLALGLLVLRFVAQRSAVGLLGLQAAIVLLMIVSALRFTDPLHAAQQVALRANTASLAFVTGVYDQQQISELFPTPELPWRNVPFLKQHHFSVFATDLASNWKKSLQSGYHVGPQRCWGAVDRVVGITAAGDDGYRVSGWSWDPLHRRSPHLIVFVADGKIVGYAQAGYSRPDVRAGLASRSAEQAGWIGYANPPESASVISVYATVDLSEHEVCQVSRLLPGPDSTAQAIQFSAGENLK